MSVLLRRVNERQPVRASFVSDRICHRNALTEKAWEDAKQGLGTAISELDTSQTLIST